MLWPLEPNNHRKLSHVCACVLTVFSSLYRWVVMTLYSTLPELQEYCCHTHLHLMEERQQREYEGPVVSMVLDHLPSVAVSHINSTIVKVFAFDWQAVIVASKLFYWWAVDHNYPFLIDKLLSQYGLLLSEYCHGLFSPDPLVNLSDQLSRLGLDPPDDTPPSNDQHTTKPTFLPQISSGMNPVALTTSHTHSKPTTTSQKLSQGNIRFFDCLLIYLNACWCLCAGLIGSLPPLASRPLPSVGGATKVVRKHVSTVDSTTCTGICGIFTSLVPRF